MRSIWKIDNLGKYISQQNIRNRGLKNIEVYSVTNSGGFTKSTEYFNKEVFSKNLSDYKLVKKNQFAYNPSRINVGSIACLSGIDFAIVSPIYIIFEVDKNNLFPNYLLRYLKSHYGTVQIKNNTQGSVRASLKYEGLEKILIPVPPIDDQIRISIILTRTEELISKRKDSILALDKFIKSVFLEMFRFTNEGYKQWEIEPLDTNTEIISGVTKGKKYKSSHLRNVPYMRVANVQDGHFDLTDIKTIKVTEDEIQQLKLRKGDLLLTEGGDPDKLGRGSVWNDEIDECIYQNHIFRVRAKTGSINPIFLSALIASQYGKHYFLKAAKQTTGIASINSKQLKAFPLIKPPKALQDQFAAIVNRVELLKFKYIQSLTQLENLYDSLGQKAFKGELDLSKILIEEQQEAAISREDGASIFTTDELCKSRTYSEAELTKIIKGLGRTLFNFDDLMTLIDNALFEDTPEYEDLKKQIYKMLEETNPRLSQVFDKDRKELVLRSNI